MTFFQRLWHHFLNEKLFQNAIYLMLATAVMAGFGFFFWLLCARLFTSDQVGIGTTLISVTSLITSFSLLGLGNSLIKYLPTSDKKNDKVNTSIALVGLTSIIISVIFVLFVGVFSPKLMFVRENLVLSILLILFTTFNSLSALADDIFTAYRSTIYVFIKNTVFSISKLILPLVLVMYGAYGIYASFGIASILAFAASVLFLVSKFNFSIRPVINVDIVKIMAKFSLGNYAAIFIGGLPSLGLPILITNSIGASYSAYFFIDMMIANLLFMIPIAVSQSLFAEGSHNETEKNEHLKKAINYITLILLPAIILTVLFGKYLLLAFGKQYSAEGTILLQLFAISGSFMAVNYIGEVLLKLKHQIKKLIIIKSIVTITILALSFSLHESGLTGIGIAWVVGNMIACVIYFVTRIININDYFYG